jgi:hypothetical protein
MHSITHTLSLPLYRVSWECSATPTISHLHTPTLNARIHYTPALAGSLALASLAMSIPRGSLPARLSQGIIEDVMNENIL